MGRDLQKRKARSSRPTIRQSNQPKKPLNPRGNSLIAKNWFVKWPPISCRSRRNFCNHLIFALYHLLTIFFPHRRRNKKETLSQNYRRLGLTAKLNKATGGAEARPSAPAAQDPLAVTPSSGLRGGVSSVRVERDADGRIVRVLHKANPLNDPLNDLESDDDDESGSSAPAGGRARRDIDDDDEEEEGRETKVVHLLERQAAAPTEKYVRHQSAREREWVERLVAKHGEDTAAMARDFKLNPMQQTEGDIKKRLKTYKEKTGQ